MIIHSYTIYEGYPFFGYSFEKPPIQQKDIYQFRKKDISLGMSKLKHEELGLKTLSLLTTKANCVAEYLGLFVCQY